MLKKIFLTVLLVLFCHGLFADVIRGVYVTAWDKGFFNREEIDATIDACKAIKATDLFVQVRKFDDAYYNSDFVPKAKEIDKDFDPLAYGLKKAKENHIKFHAWFVICRISNNSYKENLSEEHIGFLDAKLKGDLVYENSVYIDPSNADARKYICRVIKEVIDKYDVDGVHLDYIRYSDQDSGYSEHSKSVYTSETGSVIYSGIDFDNFRRKQINNLVKEINNTVKGSKDGNKIILSAAFITWGNFSDYNKTAAYTRGFQDWSYWISKKLIDVGIPMLYKREHVVVQAADYRAWLSGMTTAASTRNLAVAVSSQLNYPKNVVSQIKLAEKAGCGWVIFAFNQGKERTDLIEAMTAKK